MENQDGRGSEESGQASVAPAPRFGTGYKVKVGVITACLLTAGLIASMIAAGERSTATTEVQPGQVAAVAAEPAKESAGLPSEAFTGGEASRPDVTVAAVAEPVPPPPLVEVPPPAPVAESVPESVPPPAPEPIPAPAPVAPPPPPPAPAPPPPPAPAPAIRTIHVAGSGGQALVDSCIGPIHFTPNDGYSLFITEHDYCGGWARFSGIGIGETVSLPGYGTYTVSSRGQVPNPGTTDDVIAVFGGFPRAILQTCIPGTSQMLLIALN